MLCVTNRRILVLLLAGALVSGACTPSPDMEPEPSAAEPMGQSLVGTQDAPCQTYTFPVNTTLALPLIMDMRAASTSLPGAGWYTNAVIQNTQDSPVHVRLKAWRR